MMFILNNKNRLNVMCIVRRSIDDYAITIVKIDFVAHRCDEKTISVERRRRPKTVEFKSFIMHSSGIEPDCHCMSGFKLRSYQIKSGRMEGNDI